MSKFFVSLRIKSRLDMNNRQKILKWCKPIGLILIGALIGCSGIILWISISKTTIAEKSSYDPWEISYNLFQI